MLKNAIEFMKRYWHDSIKLWILRKTKFESRKRWWSEKCKPWILQYRTYSLGWASLIGIIFAFVVYWIFCALKNYVLHGSLTILALGLPTFFILWLFRTHDMQRQIDKTEENTNNSTLFECVRMLTEKYPLSPETEFSSLANQISGSSRVLEKSLSKRIALEQLAYLKRETGFDEERIGLITQGINLSSMHLDSARLSGLNLSKARLVRTNLSSADLNGVKFTDADLYEANLSGADLRYADLSYADLRGTDLSNFADNHETKWKYAIYSATTKFSGTRFEDVANREKEDMIYKPDEQK